MRKWILLAAAGVTAAIGIVVNTHPVKATVVAGTGQTTVLVPALTVRTENAWPNLVTVSSAGDYLVSWQVGVEGGVGNEVFVGLVGNWASNQAVALAASTDTTIPATGEVTTGQSEVVTLTAGERVGLLAAHVNGTNGLMVGGDNGGFLIDEESYLTVVAVG